MKHKINFNLLFVSFLVSMIPLVGLAKGPGGLIPCDGVNCTLEDVFTLINTLITFAITRLFFPIFIVLILYVGWSYLSAQGNATKVAKVKTMAWNLFLGILLVLGAWLIVRTAILAIGVDKEVLMFLGDK